MEVTVRFFGPAAEAAGRPSLSVQLPDSSTVADAIAAARIDSRGARFAVGTEYVDASRTLRPGDVVSLIPPVGGG